MVFDPHASTLDIVGFTEGVAERGRVARHAIGRPLMNPTTRIAWLLRASCAWPRGCRELARQMTLRVIHVIPAIPDGRFAPRADILPSGQWNN
jgi:hypothetical protein